jgi:peptide/nickel transport system substrate-binding protein
MPISPSGNVSTTPHRASRRAPLRRWSGRRFAAASVAAVCLVTGVAACDLADASSPARQPKKGGTLYVNLQGGLDLLDPQRSYSAVEWNVLRLTTRSLTAYRAEPGAAASEIVPDLATDTGRPSPDKTVWEFTLKPNIRWQGGEPVTCSQVKYGVERRFSTLPEFAGGAPYPLTYLKGNASPYQGPWIGNNNNGRGLESVQCLDERTIRFNLSQAIGDFGYAVAIPTFAPVLPEKDTKVDYGKRPYSNGPYKVESWSDENLVMVRNGFWVEGTDQIRKAWPDRIVFDFRADDSGALTNELIEDQGDARNTIMLDTNVAPNFLQQVINDADLVNRALTGPTGAVRYIAISTRNVPNLACRQALIYAFNKRKWRAINGGSVTGDYATTMIPPGLRSHKNFDVYSSLTNPEGDPDKTIALMEEQAKANKPCKSTIRVAFAETALRRRLMTTVVEAYQLAGIQVKPVPMDPATFYRTGVGDPANPYEMIVAGWVPDWPNGSAVLPPQFHGRVIPKPDAVTGKAEGNVNFALLDDPEINEQMDAALAEASPERQWALWGDLDQQIQERAVTIPILYEKAIRLTGSNVVGGFVHSGLGMPDLVSLGLADPS